MPHGRSHHSSLHDLKASRRVLFNITDMERPLTELEKVLHASFEALLTSFLHLL
jgi:hypothetical protein